MWILGITKAILTTRIPPQYQWNIHPLTITNPLQSLGESPMLYPPLPVYKKHNWLIGIEITYTFQLMVHRCVVHCFNKTHPLMVSPNLLPLAPSLPIHTFTSFLPSVPALLFVFISIFSLFYNIQSHNHHFIIYLTITLLSTIRNERTCFYVPSYIVIFVLCSHHLPLLCQLLFIFCSYVPHSVCYSLQSSI